MSKQRRLTDEEKKLLKEAMRDVVPIPKKALAEELETPVKPLKKRIIRSASVPASPPPPPASGKADAPTVTRVQKGEYAIDGRLDLHGRTLEQAHNQLVAFIEAQYRAGSRCLLVITGKGREGEGLLQREVPRWLTLSGMKNMIHVVSKAKPKHGGDGALYVLLRRKKT